MLTVKAFPVNPLEENCYVVHDETLEACIIDCGCLYEEEWRTIKLYIEKNGLHPVHLLNTHCHFDHIFGTGMAFRDYQLKPCMHPKEVQMYVDIEGQLQAFDIATLRHAPIPPVGLQIDEGDTLAFGSHIINVIHTPGHSAGGLCYYIESEKTVFTGDTLFRGSIGRTDFIGGSYQDILQSIRQKLYILPPDTLVYPGHGPSSTIDGEMTTNIYV